LLEPIAGWPVWGGNGARDFCIGFSEPAFESGAWEPAFTTNDFRNPIGPMIGAAGEVIYLVGRALQFWQPGNTPRSTLLDEAIPDEPWRLAEVGGSIFAVGESAVFVSPIGRGKRWKLEGVYMAHGAIGTTWLGLRRDGTLLHADLYASDGERLGSHALGNVPEAVLQPVVLRDSAYVVSSRGKVWQVDRTAVKEIANLQEENLQYSLVIGDSIYCVGQRGQGVIVANVRSDGRAGPKFPIEKLVDISSPPLAAKDRLLLVGRQPDKIFNIDALTLRSGFQPTHGYLNVESALAIDDGETTYGVLAGGDQNQKAVTIVNTRSGHLVAQPFRTTGRASIKMIAADGHLIVASSHPGDNRIRAYKL
jgi:hypothetical protein